MVAITPGDDIVTSIDGLGSVAVRFGV